MAAPKACPLGKLAFVTITSCGTRSGRARAKTCFNPVLNIAPATVAATRNMAIRQWRDAANTPALPPTISIKNHGLPKAVISRAN